MQDWRAAWGICWHEKTTYLVLTVAELEGEKKNTLRPLQEAGALDWNFCKCPGLWQEGRQEESIPASVWAEGEGGSGGGGCLPDSL